MSWRLVSAAGVGTVGLQVAGAVAENVEPFQYSTL